MIFLNRHRFEWARERLFRFGQLPKGVCEFFFFVFAVRIFDLCGVVAEFNWPIPLYLGGWMMDDGDLCRIEIAEKFDAHELVVCEQNSFTFYFRRSNRYFFYFAVENHKLCFKITV